MNPPPDLAALYNACLSGPGTGKLTAYPVSCYLSSPYHIYCEEFAPETEREPMTAYQQLLFDSGKAHEQRVIATLYPDIVPIHYVDHKEGFRMLLDEMVKGSDALYRMPVFYLPEDLQGEPDILERSDDHTSVFGPYHYCVKEIKSAKNITEEHILQAAFYNYILGKIQDYTPPAFSLINRDMEETCYAYADYERKLKLCVEGSRAILEGRETPTPTYGSCGWPWSNYCDQQAEAIGDVSLVAEVGPGRKAVLVPAGFATVEDVVKASTEELTALKGIGVPTAHKMLRSSQAINQGTPIIIDLDEIKLPEKPVEIFLDLEGTDHREIELEVTQVDYLIGIIIRKEGQEEFRPFIAHHWDQEAKMFHEFLEYLASVEDCVIYHWHDYERWHLAQLAERHGIPQELKDKLEESRIDLHKMLTKAVVPPTYGNKLKEVAGYLGFEWRHEGVDALESVAMYLEYAKDNEANKDKLQLILDYNEDDCRATRVVKDWLVQLKRKGDIELQELST